MNVNLSRLEATLSRDEGKNLERHQVDGVDHIGIGRNLEGRGLSDDEMQVLGVSDEDEVQVITEEQCTYLFENDLVISVSICKSIFDVDLFQSLSQVRQEVLINIAFNLGEPRMRRFTKMIAAVNESDWEEAADEMLDSKAARQTGERYTRLANAFEHDDPDAFEVEYDRDEPEIVTDEYEYDEIENQAMAKLESIEDRLGPIDGRLEQMEKTLYEMRDINKKLLDMLSPKQKSKKSFLSGIVL